MEARTRVTCDLRRCVLLKQQWLAAIVGNLSSISSKYEI
jgi:hypothetical protein